MFFLKAKQIPILSAEKNSGQVDLGARLFHQGEDIIHWTCQGVVVRGGLNIDISQIIYKHL